MTFPRASFRPGCWFAAAAAHLREEVDAAFVIHCCASPVNEPQDPNFREQKWPTKLGCARWTSCDLRNIFTH